MSHFHYQQGQLWVEEVDLNTIAAAQGTPTFVYSRTAITEAYGRYTQALGDFPGQVFYAVKANGNLAILQCLAALGSGFDIVSGGELEKVLLAGGDPGKVLFSGVGKTRAEMRRALEVGIACFNIESLAEIDRLAAVAKEIGLVAPISLRVNPDVDAKTHPYISTGLKENKFGINMDAALAAYQRAATFDSLHIIGIDCHIGSQLTDTKPLLEACDRLLDLYDRLLACGIEVHHLDIGGGIGVVYRDEVKPSIDNYFAVLKQKLGQRPLSLYCEPGRSIVATAGVLLMRVEYLKENAGKHFAVVDAAMNDYIRPALYHAWQGIQNVQEHPKGETQRWDIVGPVCESTDFLGKDRELCLSEGDLLALMSSGAYGMVLSSNYNARPRAAEVLVNGSQWQIVRERESLQQLWANEKLLSDID
jgi:diaminopimelate decarboxylase